MFRTSIVIGLTVFGAGLIRSWWDRFKEREASRPIPMKYKNGVYIPWGTVQKAQRVFGWIQAAWLVYMAMLLMILAYVKLVDPNFVIALIQRL